MGVGAQLASLGPRVDDGDGSSAGGSAPGPAGDDPHGKLHEVVLLLFGPEPFVLHVEDARSATRCDEGGDSQCPNSPRIALFSLWSPSP